MKHNRLIIALVATLFVSAIHGQHTMITANLHEGIVSVLDSIEANNTTLIALRTEADAHKLQNRTDITLSDPEVGLKRMWEGAEEDGKLTEFTVSQRIDLATVTGQRSRVARQQNMLIDETYRMARMEILLEAQLVCIDIAYYAALASELDRRLEHARQVLQAEKTRFENGDTDILSYNNVLLSFSALEAERARVTMERNVLISHLTALNGGHEFTHVMVCDRQAFDQSASIVRMDFDTWYTEASMRLPQLARANQLRAVRSSELSLAKTMHIPSLLATYINERHTIGSRSQGITVGVSIPLWANKNRVRSARTALEAAEAQQRDTELQLRSELEQEFMRVKGLHHTATLYQRALSEANNSELLQHAMDEGFISVLEYLQGIELYYDYLDRSLNAERDYQRAVAELEAWKL